MKRTNMIALWRSYHGQSEDLCRAKEFFGSSTAAETAAIGAAWFSVEVPDAVVIVTNGGSGEQVIYEVFQAIAHAYGWQV